MGHVPKTLPPQDREADRVKNGIPEWDLYRGEWLELDPIEDGLVLFTAPQFFEEATPVFVNAPTIVNLHPSADPNSTYLIFIDSTRNLTPFIVLVTYSPDPRPKEFGEIADR